MRPIDWLSTKKSPPTVFSVGQTSAQVMWGGLEPGPVSLSSNQTTAHLEHPGGAGGLTIYGLIPNSEQKLSLRSGRSEYVLRARTLAPIGGEVLARVATVSDLHLTAGNWGYLRTMGDRNPEPYPHPLRCGRAAIREAISWGADHLVIKGDATDHRTPASFAALGSLVDEFEDLAMTLMPGNHDVDRKTRIDFPSTVGQRELEYVTGVDKVALGGAAVVALNTTEEYKNSGTVAARIDEASELMESDQPTLVMLHHHLHQHRVPTYWPLGVPLGEAEAFLAALGKKSQRILVSSGHTHRNSTRYYPGQAGRFPVTQVASTKDWPGVWAAYTLYEGGIRQEVRRIEAPEAVNWHEYSRHALLGLWSGWAPGELTDRSFNHTWRKK